MLSRLVFAALLGSLATLSVAQDRIDVDTLRQRSTAGDKAATRALADAYYVGRGGVEQDFAQAAQWYRQLAAQGDARAQTSLGLMYARGLGFPRDMVEARRWWSLAAAQNDAGAQHNLGMIFFEGQGTPKDLAQARHWFERAAERGHVQAQRMIGLMYYEGAGTAPDELKGLTWIAIAAQSGEEGAHATLKVLAAKVDPALLAQAHAHAAAWLKRYNR